MCFFSKPNIPQVAPPPPPPPPPPPVPTRQDAAKEAAIHTQRRRQRAALGGRTSTITNVLGGLGLSPIESKPKGLLGT